MLIDMREGERGKEVGREREKLTERETSIDCLLYMPPLGIEPATQVCVLSRNQTHHLFMYGTMLQPTEPSGHL